jgi:hypothetical protein
MGVATRLDRLEGRTRKHQCEQDYRESRSGMATIQLGVFAACKGRGSVSQWISRSLVRFTTSKPSLSAGRSVTFGGYEGSTAVSAGESSKVLHWFDLRTERYIGLSFTGTRLMELAE